MADHLDGSTLLWLNNKDVAPDLVAKLDVSSLHSEVGGVSAFLSWSLALDSHLSDSVSLDLIANIDWFSTNIISGGLEEFDISWPGGFSVVSEDPSLSKFGTSLNFMLVIDAFLHKAGLVSWVLWLGSWSLLLFCKILLDKSDFCRERLVHLNILVLANKLSWRMFRLSDFQHGVSCVDSIALTVLANVVI